MFIPTSQRLSPDKQDSGQQWDGRNAWPPLQWMIIQGLRNSASALTPPATGTESSVATTAGAATAAATQAARQLASEVEEAFLDGALAGWESTGAMMEKYDADEVGKGGGGGEYNLQVAICLSSLRTRIVFWGV